MNEIVKIGPDNYLAKLQEHVEPMNTEASLILKSAQTLVIKTDEDARLAKEDWVKLREKQANHEADRKEITVPINGILGQINAAFKTADNAWGQARTILNDKVQAHNRKKEEERQEAERKAQEEAKKEEDRIRKEKEKKEAELREKEAEKRREAERLEKEAEKTKNAEKKRELEAQAEKRRQEADKAAAKADEKAQEAQTVFVAAPTIAKTEIKVSGAKKVVRYFAKVINPKLVPVEWAGRTLRPVDESAIGEVARALKLTAKDESPIPGVSFYSEEKLG